MDICNEKGTLIVALRSAARFASEQLKALVTSAVNHVDIRALALVHASFVGLCVEEDCVLW